MSLKSLEPTNLKDFLNNDVMYSFIMNLIYGNNLHILFQDSKSSGKTTLLKLIQKEYFANVTNSDIAENIMDLNQLNEQSISFFRNELKLFCQTSSNIDKKKLILIDDIDLLSEQNQKILRCYLDKYSKNINMICSCNNLNKVISSLQSRLFLLKLKNNFNDFFKSKILKNKQLIEHLGMNQRELKKLMKTCNNCFKIFYNTLLKIELLKKSNNFKLKYLNELTYFQNTCLIKDLFLYITQKSYVKSLKIIDTLIENGLSNNDILELIFMYVKENYHTIPISTNDLLFLICNYIKDSDEGYHTIILFTHELYNMV